MSDENGSILDLGSIDFTPDWAKKDAGVNLGKIRPERDEREKGISDQGSGISKSFGDRKPFGEKKPFSNPPSRSFGAAGKKPFSKKPFGKPRFERPRFEDRPKPLDVEVVYIPATQMAKDMQAVSLANMIILGAIVEKLKCVKYETVIEALKHTISARKANLLDLNLKAVEAGAKFIKG